MNKAKLFHILLILFIGGIGVQTFTGCGPTKVPVQVERPPNLDISGIKSIAVVPGGDANFEADLIQMFRNHFTVIENSEGNADAMFYWNKSHDFGRNRYENTIANTTEFNHCTIAIVELNYHIKTADGRTIGPISKKERNDYCSGYEKITNFSRYPDQSSALSGAISKMISSVAQDFAPYKVTEQRALAEDKTGASGVKAEMKKALAHVEAKEYRLALEIYLGIYEQHKSPAAAENASIVYEALGNTEGALSIAQKAYEETNNPAIQQVIARLSKNLDDKAKVTAIKPTQQQEKVAPSEKKPSSIIDGEFTDARDGKKYKTVIIGEQIWMAENLNYDVKKSVCYNKKPANCEKYGRMYNFEMAKKACPSGWHLPSKSEWEVLYEIAGGGDAAGKKLKAKSWNGTDDYGFSALPGESGHFGTVFDTFFGPAYGASTSSGGWWSATEYTEYNDNNSAYSLHMNELSESVHFGSGDKYSLLSSVRCVNDAKAAAIKPAPQSEEKVTPSEEEPGSIIGGEFTDARDGKKYKTVIIGEQTWMAENLNYNPGTVNSVCYDNNPANCTKHGRLYDWKTARTVCPAGWHLPNKSEWEALDEAVGGQDMAGKKLKSKNGWNINGNGTDNYSFSALPGGFGRGGYFYGVGYGGYWWSAMEDGSRNAFRRNTRYNNEEEGWHSSSKYDLFSVRCIQNAP